MVDQPKPKPHPLTLMPFLFSVIYVAVWLAMWSVLTYIVFFYGVVRLFFIFTK